MTNKTEFATARKIPPVFDPEELGASLHEVAVDVVQLDSESIISRWFHSSHDADLLIWTDAERNVIKHQTSFLGQVVEWNVFDGVRTGLIVEEESASAGAGASDEASEVIQFDAQPQPKTIQQATRLLQSVSDLTAEDRTAMVNQLLTSPAPAKRAGRTKLERLLRQQHRPGFWKRLRNWFSGTK